MAKKAAHPGRTIVVFFIGLAVVFGLVALGGSWKPGLGLDLQGGTRITLTTEGDDVDPANLQEAADIIDQRVNGSGVTEAEVTTQANQYIVVEIPGERPDDLVEVVKRQAQLRFRLVAQQAPGTGPQASPTGPTSTEVPGSGVTAPGESPTSSGSTQPGTQPDTQPGSSESATPRNRPLPGFAAATQTATQAPSKSASPSPSEPSGPSESPSGQPGTPPADETEDPLVWQTQPDSKSSAAFAEFSCPADGTAPQVRDNPDVPLITCDEEGNKYLLSKAIIEGTSLTGASAQIPQNEVSWAVSLSLDGTGSRVLREVSQALVGDQSKTFAITLDGVVISSAYFSAVITDGNAQISGGFTQDEAQALATSLKFGSLPIAFQDDVTVEDIGPSLAGNQLSAGITAGIFGLALVMLYCLFYYRGLGLVVLASLVVAGVLTYGLVLLLSETAGFTMTLPGIAGLIVAVGITADSFIVFFERIRDEMRDGRSMRVAVESGWVRARNTCLAADAVSLLAAVVLYFFAAGVVKGFAFALGLSTLIDLGVFFWFTKPMVSWLGHFEFFNKGHKLSGLDAENLGLDRLPGVSVGVKAR